MPWSRVQPTLIDRDIATIVAVASAKIVADHLTPDGLELTRQALQWPLERLNPAPLLTGDDLRELGIPAGPMYREILQSLRDRQLDGQLKSRDEAIAALDQWR